MIAALKEFLHKPRDITERLGNFMLDMYNTKVLVRHQIELEKTRNAIEKRDLFIERWNTREQSFFLPAAKWDKEDRVVSTFTFRAFLVLLLSLLLVVPAIFIVPLLITKYSRRETLKKEIIKQQTIIKTTLPIPLTDDEYTEVSDTYWGRQFIDNGIIFLRFDRAQMRDPK